MDDRLGQSVAVWGNVAIVGASAEDGGPGDPQTNAGAAYIFRRNKNGASLWGQVQKLRASDTQSYDEFGNSVAISGEYAIVGAYQERGGPGDPAFRSGAAYIFRRDQGGPGNWGEVQKLMAPDPQTDDRFGVSVAISGDFAIVGAHTEDGGLGDPLADAGAAYVFQNVGGSGWLHLKTLRASDAESGDRFGHSVAISGDVAVVGADSEDGGFGDPLPQAGAAYVFGRNQDGANKWGEVEKLVALDHEAGDSFGVSVGISGKVAVVGATGEDGGPGDPISGIGAVYVFEDLAGFGWTQVRKLTAADAKAGNGLGVSVAISGGVIVAGVLNDDGGPGDPLPTSGAAYAFIRHFGGKNAWGQARKLTAPDAASSDAFGRSVAVSGKNIISGASLEDGGPGDPAIDAGAAYVFYVSLLEAFKGN